MHQPPAAVADTESQVIPATNRAARDSPPEFEDRVGRITSVRGAKREMVRDAVRRLPVRFKLADLQDICPGVSYPTLKRALAELKRDKLAKCLGKGRDAEWERIGSWSPSLPGMKSQPFRISPQKLKAGSPD